MISKRRGVLFNIGLISAAMMFPWSLNYANASDFVQITKSVKLKPKAPVTIGGIDSPVRADVNVNEKFSSLTGVCFHFIFDETDAIDPNEGLTISIKGTDIGTGFGFFNPTSVPQTERVICYNPNEIPSELLDGKATYFITGESAIITSLSVEFTGYSK